MDESEFSAGADLEEVYGGLVRARLGDEAREQGGRGSVRCLTAQERVTAVGRARAGSSTLN
eukprot:scaffold2263_cov391-Prasinococcus_capsulatus_cf.AAC.10